MTVLPPTHNCLGLFTTQDKAERALRFHSKDDRNRKWRVEQVEREDYPDYPWALLSRPWYEA